MHEHTNALAQETSPYLLQHAHNPVDWRPWGEEALQVAQADDKLMIISIGYAACHWCHVMERESFEDSTVANVMNAGFVTVKVDREERPDVDDVYMSACHLSSGGSCGWPLNAIALPDGRPIWAGTYFPKKKWLEVLDYFTKLQQTEPEKLETYATQLANQLAEAGAQPPIPQPQNYDQAVGKDNLKRLVMLADPTYGGMGSAPKFPMPVLYEFMLDEANLSGNLSSLKVLDRALQSIARGGIYDQLGGGFARYSVDAAWHAPHFEKMLYDNGQLVSLYAHAFRQNPSPEYEKVIRQTLAFVQRELTNPAGGFYSSLDADSEGEEGKFYVWTYDELYELLSEKELDVLMDVYDIRRNGNWEHGNNILHRQGDLPTLAKKRRMELSELKRFIDKAEVKLMEARDKRVRPGLDDKVLVSWNGLMIKGYVDAYLALGDETYLKTAIREAKYLESSMLQDDGRLLRTSAKGKAHINAFLDDYANLADAYLALYQATFDEKWLKLSQKLVDYTLVHFSNPSASLLYFTSDIDPPLVARRVEDADNVIPASNSMMADNLVRLGTIMGREEYVQRGKDMVASVLPNLAERRQPAYWSRWLSLHSRLAHKRYEVAVVGPNAKAVRLQLAEQLIPQATFIGSESTSELALLEGKYQEGKTLIYVCENRVCQLPTDQVDVAIKQLSGE
ncbi:MAG: thioredoxin domain-containing protein [Saprospiraceae bacterium]